MKDSTSTPVVRIVGSRKPGKLLSFLHPVIDDIEVDANAPETQQEFDARCEDEELRIRRAIADAHIQKLSPSQQAFYLALAPVLDSHHRVRARVAAGGRLLVSVRIPSDAWFSTLETVFTAWIAKTRIEYPELSEGVRGRFADEGRWPTRRFDPRAIFRDIATSHIFLSRGNEADDQPLDPAVEVALDADIFLREIPFAFFREAFTNVFPDAMNLAEPEGWSAARLEPFVVDNVCRRCDSASEAFALVEAMIVADEQANAAKEKSRRDEEEKPKTTSNRGVTATQILRPTSPRLEDLHGYGLAASWASDLCIDLAAYQSGDLGWSDVDAGCLLFGPPGTGKTMFASALAASAGLPFIATSYAEWQSQGDGHLGYVIRTLKQRFADATSNAPAILFIDEIDVVGTRGAGRDGDGWWTAIITALLEALDGTTRREGLVVIAACNDPSALDPALVRSGRLDRRFEIGLPDEASLARIFAHHLPGSDQSAFETAATVLAGTCTGADVARIAREARRRARREKRDLVADDLLAIAMPPDTRSPEYRRLVAIHESGHAVAMMLNGRIPDVMSIISSGDSSGRIRSAPDFTLGRVGEFEREAVVMLAGRAAEDVLFGEASAGAASDLERATSFVQQIVASTGLGGRLSVSESVSASEIENRIRELYGRALRLVTERRADVEALADLALERRVLSHRALAEFARERGLGGVR